MTSEELKNRIIEAGYKAVEELIKVASEKIITGKKDDDLAADKLKNAAATKRLAIEDAFSILSRIEVEKENIIFLSTETGKTQTKQGFAERRSK
jgi:hypothetical protein